MADNFHETLRSSQAEERFDTTDGAWANQFIATDREANSSNRTRTDVESQRQSSKSASASLPELALIDTAGNPAKHADTPNSTAESAPQQFHRALTVASDQVKSLNTPTYKDAQEALLGELRDSSKRAGTFAALDNALTSDTTSPEQSARIKEVLSAASTDKIHDAQGNAHDGLGRLVDMQGGLKIEYDGNHPSNSPIKTLTNDAVTLRRGANDSYTVHNNASGTQIGQFSDPKFETKSYGMSVSDSQWELIMVPSDRK